MSVEIILAFAFGVIFVITLITLAVFISEPTPFQDRVFRVVLALSAAGIAAIVPGFLNVELTSTAGLIIRAGGAIAVFIIVYFFTPDLMGAATQELKKNMANSISKDSAKEMPEWIEKKDVSLLEEQINLLPNGHRIVLSIIAGAGKTIRPSDFIEVANPQFTRREIVYICRELTEKMLITTAYRTDYEYELSPYVANILGDRTAEVIRKNAPVS